jgi:hypothetical protein
LVVGLVGLANPDADAAAVGAFITNFPDSAFFLGSLIRVIFLYTVSTRAEERRREVEREEERRGEGRGGEERRGGGYRTEEEI